MVWVEGIGPAPPAVRGSGRSPATGAGFRLPPAGAEAPAAAASMGEVALGGMLALQEAEGREARDREARRHGQEMLAALARLQRALLEGGRDLPGLRRLALLAENVPEAADPALRLAMAEVVLRARVELARHETITTG
jgi:hypothetical protein